MAQNFSSVAMIVTTDFEALYAYKRGDYQRCLQLSTQNVHMLLYTRRMPYVHILPDFMQLLDDDIASLTALTLLVNRTCRDQNRYVCISQSTLSLYLMTQCQLKLHHSITSLAQTLSYIEVARRRHPRELRLEQLVLKLIQCKANWAILHWSWGRDFAVNMGHKQNSIVFPADVISSVLLQCYSFRCHMLHTLCLN